MAFRSDRRGAASAEPTMSVVDISETNPERSDLSRTSGPGNSTSKHREDNESGDEIDLGENFQWSSGDERQSDEEDETNVNEPRNRSGVRLSTYERERDEKMRKNLELLGEMGLEGEGSLADSMRKEKEAREAAVRQKRTDEANARKALKEAAMLTVPRRSGRHAVNVTDSAPPAMTDSQTLPGEDATPSSTRGSHVSSPTTPTEHATPPAASATASENT